MTKVLTTSDARFPFDVLRSDLPVLVEFHASWCAQCRAVAPVIEQLATDLAGTVKVVTVDVERHRATADRLGIRHVPTLLLFKDGVEQLRLVEATRRARIEAALAEAGIDLVSGVDA